MRLQISGPHRWKAGSVHFLRGGERIWQACCQASGSKSFSHCSGSSQQQRMSGGERERGGERGREGERDKGRQRSVGGRRLTPLMVGLLRALASFFKIQSPQLERGSIKHSSQQGSRDAASVSEHPNGL